jgi:hypothetical protein
MPEKHKDMPSLVWRRDPVEAFENPYEYSIQEQFSREARALFAKLYLLLDSRGCFTGEERSPAKAGWLLAMDALDSLRECLDALGRKDHRVAGKLFRDVMETMDLASYFRNGGSASRRYLNKWYADEVVPHRVYRDYVKRTRGDAVAQQLAAHYRELSRFNHRSYRVILASYSQGREDRLVHDRVGERYGVGEAAVKSMVLPQTLANYYAVLANLVIEYASDLLELGLVTQKQIQDAFAASLEAETVPRRFVPIRWLASKLRNQKSVERP